MHSLKLKLSLTTALVVLLTVALISFLSNFWISRQFKKYIKKQQEQTTQELVSNLSKQYNQLTNTWNLDFLHTIGMNGLYDGYIIKVYDMQNQSVWDAESHDMSLCAQVMSEISERMRIKYPKINGEFTSQDFNLVQNAKTVGSVNISYFGPYFLSENDFQFLDALNKILIKSGLLSLACSIVVGLFIAKRVSDPILKTIVVAKQISNGDYMVRIEERTDTRELEELIKSINHLADSLGKQEHLRKQLTADVAHELRTPLTTVGTHLEAMTMGVWEPSVERLQSCHDEVGRIGKIVTDLENLAKVESENLKLNKTQIDLPEIMKKVVGSLEMEIKNKNLNITLTGNCSYIYADQNRISQVVLNLLTNALKYTPDNGNINIEFYETEETVAFCIKDDGIGISEEELPFIFERFYRSDKSRNRMTGGSGIGLAIVKSIVIAHDGKIKVQSKLNYGSSFEVTLPK